MSWLLAGTTVASGLVAVLTVHTLINARLLRRPPGPVSFQDGVTLQESLTVRESLTVQESITVPESAAIAEGTAVVESVAVLLPLRDEADRVSACLHALLQQRGVPRLRLVVLDDGSTDGTADVVRGIDPRIELHPGRPLPDGWLGKPHACHQLAETVPDATVLVFVDADVVLEPHAVAASVSLLRSTGVDLLSPYPRIVALGVGERIVQPLLQWSWLTFLPLRALERSARPSLSAAGGQLLVADQAGYRRAGGHAGVRGEILEDIALARAVKRAGGRVALADGSQLATCRMYTSWRELVDGYGKSLWASFGPPAGAAAVVLLLLYLYAVPPVLGLAAAAGGRWALATVGMAGYALAVIGRLASARATGGRSWPDALAHPLSVASLAWLTTRSYHLRRRRRLTWRGRPVGIR